MDSAFLIEWVLEHINYLWVFIFMVIESSFIPFPSEIVVPPAAYRAASTGEMNVFLIVLVATVGALVGSLINYYLAFGLGRKILYALTRRYGKYLLLDENKIKTAEEYFNEHGVVSTLVGRLIPAVRQLISIPAGLSKMNLAKFILFTFVGAGAWNTVLASAGYYLQSIMPEDKMLETVKFYNHEFTIVCFSIIAIIIAVVVYKIFFVKK